MKRRLSYASDFWSTTLRCAEGPCIHLYWELFCRVTVFLGLFSAFGQERENKAVKKSGVRNCASVASYIPNSKSGCVCTKHQEESSRWGTEKDVWSHV